MFVKDSIKLFDFNKEYHHHGRMWSLFRTGNINFRIFDSKNFSVESRDIVKEYQPGSREFMKKLKDDNCLNEDFCKNFFVSIVNSQGTFILFWKELFHILYNASEDQTNVETIQKRSNLD